MTTHHERWEPLLPWYLNGTLQPEEARDMRAHAATCVTCRSALRDLEEIQDAVEQTPIPGFDVESGVRALRMAVEGPEASRQRADPSRWAPLAAAATMLLALGAAWLLAPQRPALEEPSHEPTFRTLSDAPAQTPPGERVAHILFSEQTTEAEIRRLLTDAEAQIIDGPDDLGLYRLKLPSETAEAAIERLEASDRVRFVALTRTTP